MRDLKCNAGRGSQKRPLGRSPHFKAVLLAAGMLGAAGPAYAARTPAGTVINNNATATYDLPGGGQSSVTSNTVSLTVDELLDVGVAWTDGGDVGVIPGATNRVLSYRVTNAGNGSEAFRLSARDSAGGDDFDPSTTSLVLDANGNGIYDPGLDTVYVAGANEPVLAPEQSAIVFVLSTIPAGASDAQRGRVDLVATAATGSGAPGTTFAGQGQGGGDAVVGATHAQAEDDGYYKVSGGSVAFVKSATVADPYGGTTSVPGAIVTYRLVATVSGSGGLANLRIADLIPPGTTYRAGTLTLEGGALSDGADADAGEFTGTGIAVRLGNVAGGNARTVTFQVSID
ncbi:hypothetical protein [Allosphingosinicella sp.]|uniref:hypothetical protein n=1 Tax=Allosphingosinicella sp. TaxID=2823234 RepID=UPI00378334D4